jgi:choline-sulfatase
MPAPIRDTLEDKPAWQRRRDLGLDEEEIAHTRRQYCASIEAVDDAIGQILAAVEERSLLENTYVVFCSDHGEMLGDHGMYTKSVGYEPALRVPLIVAGPGLPRGRVSKALIELIDLNPTICELAGLPPQENIDARSFAPTLRGQTENHREDQLSTLAGLTLLRAERYKLIHNANDGYELYDLETDPAELRNQAGDRPELVRDLTRRLEARTTEDTWLR